MRSVGLLLKVLWSPAEAMFLVSKNPRALVPIVFLALCSLAGGMLVMAKVPASELAMRAIERSPQGANLSDQQKDLIRQRINSPVARVFGIISAVVGPIFIVLIVASVYFGIFTIVGRKAASKRSSRLLHLLLCRSSSGRALLCSAPSWCRRLPSCLMNWEA